MDTNNKQCNCNKDKVINDLLKRISNLEFDVEDKQREIESLKQINEEHQKLNGELRAENDRLNNIVNELKEWFKGYHKNYASCKWYEEDYIEFIEHLENELKGSNSNE